MRLLVFALTWLTLTHAHARRSLDNLSAEGIPNNNTPCQMCGSQIVCGYTNARLPNKYRLNEMCEKATNKWLNDIEKCGENISDRDRVLKKFARLKKFKFGVANRELRSEGTVLGSIVVPRHQNESNEILAPQPANGPNEVTDHAVYEPMQFEPIIHVPTFEKYRKLQAIAVLKKQGFMNPTKEQIKEAERNIALSTYYSDMAKLLGLDPNFRPTNAIPNCVMQKPNGERPLENGEPVLNPTGPDTIQESPRRGRPHNNSNRGNPQRAVQEK